MKCLSTTLLLISIIIPRSIWACDSKKLLDCLNQKGGVTCFYNYSCEQDKFKLEYCHNFNLEICLQYDGGKACLANLDECNYLLSNEKKQQNSNNNMARANNRSKEPSKLENSPTKADNESHNNPIGYEGNNEDSPKVAKCSKAEVQKCLKNQGGESCFQKYGCESSGFKISFCQSFSVNKCLNFSGGKACYKTQSFCNTIVSNQPKNQPIQLTNQAPSKEYPQSTRNPSPVITKNQNKNNNNPISKISSKTESKTERKEVNNQTHQSPNAKDEPIEASKECVSQKVDECQQRGGGDECYLDNHCTPLSYQANFCQNFNVDKCTLNQGGQTCLQILKNCQLFLTKVLPREQEKVESYNDKSCQKEKALLCLEKEGGATCFSENLCDKSHFQKQYCTNFKFSKCIDHEGGQACQKNHDACELYNIANNDSSENLNRHNNFEGYLSILTDKNDPNHFQNIGKPVKICDETMKPSDEYNRLKENKPSEVDLLIKEFEKFGKGVKTYSLGVYNKEVTDCSGFIMQAMKKLGFSVNGPQFDLNPNYPKHFKSCDPNNLKPGDVLLLNYPGRIPDHWIMVAGKGSWPSGNIDMMDVSSDYVDGKPFYHGKLNRRSNLRAREVYSCVRHKDFSK